MKIAHFSDLHICQKYRPRNLERTKLLIDYALKQETDHFVFTGDLVHLGNKEDFIVFRNLLDGFNLLDSSRVTLVIGNHDIFGGVYFAEDVLTFPHECERIDYHQKLIEFKNYFFETFENTYFPATNEPYPFAKILGNVALIGLNSIHPYSRWKNPFASKGWVQKAQRENFKQILSRNEFRDKIKIVLIHHHFQKISHRCSLFANTLLRNIETYGNKLKNRVQIAKLLSKYKVDLVLHGHEHDSHEYFYKGLHFMNAGGCIDKNNQDELQLNFITVTKNVIKTEIRKISNRNIWEYELSQNSDLVLAS